MQTWLITLKNTNLIWKVNYYKIEAGRIYFTDAKTNLAKSFPQQDCWIEEVRK